MAETLRGTPSSTRGGGKAMHPGLPVGRGQTGADSNGGEFEDSRGYQSSPEVDTVQPLTYSESNDTDDDLLDHTEMTKSLSFDSGV